MERGDGAPGTADTATGTVLETDSAEARAEDSAEDRAEDSAEDSAEASAGGSGAADATPRSGMPRATIILVGAASAVILCAGAFITSWLLGPVLLALVIVIAVYPIKTWLQAKGWPTWAAVLSLLVVIYGTLLVLTAFLIASVSQLGALLAENSDKAKQLAGSVSKQLTALGVNPEQARQTGGSADLSKLATQIGTVLSSVGSVIGSLVFILALMLFLTAESGGTARRMGMISRERPHMTSALDGFVHGTRNYLLVTAVFGLIVAVLDTAALAIMGIQLALLWGVLAFITNFIPNIGFIIGLVPPALLALLTGGWQLALAVVVVYCVLNLVIQSLIQPRFVGDSVGLSATVTFVALLFWAWILGPLGALLAIPVTLLAKAVFVDSDPRAGWVEALLGAEPSKPRGEKRSRRHRRNGTAPESVEDAGDVAPPVVMPAPRTP